jgi:hypothetical protein
LVKNIKFLDSGILDGGVSHPFLALVLTSPMRVRTLFPSGAEHSLRGGGGVGERLHILYKFFLQANVGLSRKD